MNIGEKLNDITTEMAEHICDKICMHPGNVSNIGITPDELEEICAECKLAQYIIDILNAGITDNKNEYLKIKILSQFEALKKQYYSSGRYSEGYGVDESWDIVKEILDHET